MHRNRRLHFTVLVVLLTATLAAGAPAAAQVLSEQLLYTPIQPCRIVDTQQPGAGGALAVNVNRAFNVAGVGFLGSLNTQGGNPNGCPIPGFAPGPTVQAVVATITAVGAAGPGSLLAWPSDRSMAAAPVMTFASPAVLGGLNVASTVILPVRQNSQGNDVTFRAQGATTDLTIDVVGYFVSVTLRQGSSTAVGSDALKDLSIGKRNTAFGYHVMPVADEQNDNTAIGTNALFALGSVFGHSGDRNTAVGSFSLNHLTYGDRNIAIGYFAGAANISGSDNIYIGSDSPTTSESSTIRIGNVAGGAQNATFVAGINGALSLNGVEVFVNANGQLGTTTSSERFKEDIEDMSGASDVLMKLRPVTFHYRRPYDDGLRHRQFGLVAEEVARVDPDLVAFDGEGRPQTVRYHFVNAMLLNEMQKQHVRIADLEAQLAEQRQVAEALDARLAKLEAAARP